MPSNDIDIGLQAATATREVPLLQSTSNSVPEIESQRLNELESEVPKKKTKHYHQNFVPKWLQDPLFQDWLEKRYNRAKSEDRAYCKYCCEFLTNGKTELKRHVEAKCHKDAEIGNWSQIASIVSVKR